MLKWQIGNVKITCVVELEMDSMMEVIIPTATPDALDAIDWLRPNFRSADGKLLWSIHALVVEVGDLTILVDTCIGNHKDRAVVEAWHMMDTPFLQNLEAAGFPRESVDMVMCTHLHLDHVGWNTMLVDGKWVPTFPNARYLMTQTEYDHWSRDKENPLNQNVMADSVQPLLDAGLVDFVQTNHRICEEIYLEPSPGHTPGHVSVKIVSKGEEALITGDSVHHPCQIAHPDWSTIADVDQNASSHTRYDLFGKYADCPVLIIGTHFAAPTAGYLRRDGDSYRFDI